MRARGSVRRGVMRFVPASNLVFREAGHGFESSSDVSLAILDQKNAGKEKRGNLDLCASTEFVRGSAGASGRPVLAEEG